MIRNLFRYDQSSVRLEIEGLPDLSLSQDSNSISILSAWKLDLIGFPQLEGKKEHLIALMNTIQPYARYVMSGVKRQFGDLSGPINIKPLEIGHEITLRSSQPNVKPLTINIDDAQLADLVRCLDSLKMDKRVIINWNNPPNLPLSRTLKITKYQIKQFIFPPIAGASIIMLCVAFFAFIPLPRKIDTIPIQSPTSTNLNSN